MGIVIDCKVDGSEEKLSLTLKRFTTTSNFIITKILYEILSTKLMNLYITTNKKSIQNILPKDTITFTNNHSLQLIHLLNDYISFLNETKLNLIEASEIQVKVNERTLKSKISSINKYIQTHLYSSFTESLPINSHFIYFVILQAILYNVIGKPFYLPIERCGLVSYANLIVLGEREVHLENVSYCYPSTLTDFKIFIHLTNTLKPKSSKLNNKLLSEIEKILEGSIEFQLTGIYYLSPKGKTNISYAPPFVKNLAGLYAYIKYVANKGDLLVIEYPYCYLSLEKQKSLKQLFNTMSKSGIRIITVE